MSVFRKLVFIISFATALVALGFGLYPHQINKAHAASTYTVDSIGDESDDNPGDLACHTALDTCTLRAAIEEVNAGAGGDTINFGIAGTGVHTLTPASCYDAITKSVTIDGYSQPGSAVNTAVAPAALNGTLTIEIDGTNAGTCTEIDILASDTTVKGLVINRQDGWAINSQNHSNTVIAGNYLGTDTTGMNIPGATRTGVSISDCINCKVGTTLPADRNILSSGNGGDRGVIVKNNSSGSTISGNYIGLAANGITVLGNKNGGIDAWDFTGSGLAIGGSASGSINVIASGDGGAVTLFGDQVTFEGNYVGLDRTGVAVAACSGGVFGANITNSTFKNNVVAGIKEASSFGSGFFFYGAGGMTGNKFQGNKIGTDKDGNAISGGGNTIGITLAGDANDNLIGGTGVGEGNIIANSDQMGINIMNLIGANLNPLNNTIIGNTIKNNGGIGIDLTGDTEPGFVPDVYVGVNPNDAGDPDESSNHFMNFPVINSATKGTGQVTVNYDLDINPAEVGATGYNVAFYANSTNAREGAIYLGSDTVPGSVAGQSKTLTLPGSVPADYYVTAVTTMTDVSSDGFGHSSEFSAPVQATLANTASQVTLASTGQNTKWLQLVALLLIISGGITVGYALRKK